MAELVPPRSVERVVAQPCLAVLTHFLLPPVQCIFFQVPFLSSAFSFQYLFFQSPNYFFPTFSSKVHLLCKFFITVNTIPHNIALPSIENGLLNTELLKLKKVQFWSLMMTSMMTALAPEPANPRNFCRHSTGTGTGTGTNPAPVGA